MSREADPRLLGRLAWWTAWAAMTELAVLRITTRTLIHIPGLADFEAPIRAVSEIGRLAYYVTVVLLIGLLVVVARVGTGTGAIRSALLSVGIAMLFLSAIAGRLGLIGAIELGWLSLVAILVVAGGTAFLRWRTAPLLLIVVATWATGMAATLQGPGGGLSGAWYDGLLRAGEIAAIGACLLLPLVLGKLLAKTAWMVGLGAAVVVTAMLTAASPTVSILVLWSFGLPASLPAIVYGLAVGCLVAVLFEAIRDGRRGLAAGLMLVFAGGVSLVSTYQTALFVAGLSTAMLELGLPAPEMQRSGQVGLPEKSEAPSLLTTGLTAHTWTPGPSTQLK